MTLETARLRLRPWTDADREPFFAMSSDPVAMAHLIALPDRAAADRWIDRQIAHLAQHGFCFWALETRADRAFAGAVGLGHVDYTAHFTPAVEIGWRVARPFWGRGYAPEAAARALRFGFETLGLPEIVANTGHENTASQRVMAKLGMTRDPADDFDHPRLPEGHILRRQRLYRAAATTDLAPPP